ncbi:L-Ala-D/L-amino acid epimerase isoform X2 [Silene latifolia]|uniref:L-Ala-D/L-amino acid epimerase isoform X2 n=1 Tax=Silene latifolia TaxID=37657 RepID=UPI003D76E677
MLFSSSNSLFFSSIPPNPTKLSNSPPNYPFKSITCSSNITTHVMDPPQTIQQNFGFKDFMSTLTVDVHRAERRPLNVGLIAPFTIASSKLDTVQNVGIRLELSNGCVGWGEAPVLPSVTAEDQPTALSKAAEACSFLQSCPPMTLYLALQQIVAILPGHQFASVRAGVEMALIDAVAKSIGVPLWRLFGGVSNTITTDITIPICQVDVASRLALEYKKQGFKTLKLKVGKNLNEDIKVLKAIKQVYPDCQFILDANEGYSPEEAVQVLQKLHDMAVTPILFEQPVHRDDWEGLGYVRQIAEDEYGVLIAADESCQSLADAKKIVKENLAGVINIKLAKLGVLGALDVIELARASNLNLMIGGMVETRLAMGFAGHLAAGLGCFNFIDLDTPILLSEDPVCGGYEG